MRRQKFCSACAPSLLLDALLERHVALTRVHVLRHLLLVKWLMTNKGPKSLATALEIGNLS